MQLGPKPQQHFLGRAGANLRVFCLEFCVRVLLVSDPQSDPHDDKPKPQFIM